MKKGYSDITIVLDRSGSMASVIQDTIGGFNTFLKEQKEGSEEATINLYQFDDKYDVVYENKKIASAKDLTDKTFVPRGSTALYDAIGKTIVTLGEKYSNMKEDDRPERVFFVIITDGEENASKEYAFDRVKELIEHQKEKYSWQFVFLGSDFSAVTMAGNIGIGVSNSAAYANTSKGNSKMYNQLSSKIKLKRSINSDVYMTSLSDGFFTEEDRADLLSDTK